MPNLILLDTNLVLLLVAGLTNQNYIRKHKRLQAYDPTDFKIVLNCVSRSSGITFAPNVLTETSNLVRQINDPIRSQLSHKLAQMVQKYGETYVTSAAASIHKDYARLGLTDAVLLILAKSGATLLTADLDLYLAAANAGLQAINYNHLREQRPDFR